jgi:DNA (cytosine-5)-methyltransferase 1
VPPYDPGKFPNKWWKLDPLKPSRTLTAHMGKDTYSHIHFDNKQSRTISVREAARLQSFPDGFRFAGAMNAAFRQIGNAVPPLLALAVARTLRKQIRQALVALLSTGGKRAA